MDGVLADFNTGVRNLGVPRNEQWFEPRNTWTAETLAGEKIKKKAMHTPGFWEGLPRMPGANKLWEFCSDYHIVVLTAKPYEDSPGQVADEKLRWIKFHLGHLDPQNFICCLRSEKKKFIGHTPHKFQILVDDDPRNCNDWQNEGGIPVHHTSADESIAQLKRIMNKYEYAAA